MWTDFTRFSMTSAAVKKCLRPEPEALDRFNTTGKHFEEILRSQIKIKKPYAQDDWIDQQLNEIVAGITRRVTNIVDAEGCKSPWAVDLLMVFNVEQNIDVRHSEHEEH